MLHCNMSQELTTSLSLDLEDVLASLQHARRQGDLGRMAHVAYWEARRWARAAQRPALADTASQILNEPSRTRDAFLAIVDQVIAGLEQELGHTH